MKDTPTMTPSATLEPAWLADAVRVDRFRLGPEIGRGGMGSVHEAWDPVLRRRVAIKLLLQVEAGAVLRMFQEAQNQARLDHPNICPIFEIGTSAQAPFIAMRLVDGHTLGEVASSLSLMEKVRLLAQAAEAMGVAHQNGLIHRDLKPTNIMIENHGGSPQSMVMDFGLAMDLTATERTLSWGMVGTPAFMSPEQAKGEPLTSASDVYSLGATLFSILLGRPPFEAITLGGLLCQQAANDAPRLRQVLPAAPRDLETILSKCLETAAHRRYPNATGLAEDLRAFLAGRSIQARPIRWPERGWRTLSRHRGLSISLAISALLLGSLGGWGWRLRTQETRKVILAQRFGWEVKDVETVLNVERLLPIHDIRPAESRVRTALDRIRQEMKQLGHAAQGPGHYALGRGLLALREPAQALLEFRAARACGFQGLEMTYAEGLAHASLYEAGLRDAFKNPSPQGREAGKARQILEHRDPALACFRAGQLGTFEVASLGEARIAHLEGNQVLCREKCTEALRVRSDEYEARTLMALSWSETGEVWAERGEDAQTERCQDEAERELSIARSIGRSDVDVYSNLLLLKNAQMIRQENTGIVDPLQFKETAQLFQDALVIRPDDALLWIGKIHLVFTEGQNRLGRGEDCQDWVQQQMKPYFLLPKLAPVEERLRLIYWVLANADQHFGRDPRPNLEEALRRLPGFELESVEESNLRMGLATYLMQHGQDPRPQLVLAEANCARLIEAWPNDSYLHNVDAQVQMVHVRWLKDTGQDASAAVAACAQKSGAAIELAPGNASNHLLMARLKTMEAQICLTHGRDPQGPLQAALASASSSLKINPKNEWGYLTLAEAQRLSAQAQASKGKDPLPNLLAARKSLSAAAALNARSLGRLLVDARLELDLLHLAPRAGGSAQRAESMTREALRTKGDDPEVWLVLAQALRLKGERAEASRALARALALAPRRVDVQAEAALQRGRQPS